MQDHSPRLPEYAHRFQDASLPMPYGLTVGGFRNRNGPIFVRVNRCQPYFRGRESFQLQTEIPNG